MVRGRKEAFWIGLLGMEMWDLGIGGLGGLGVCPGLLGGEEERYNWITQGLI